MLSDFASVVKVIGDAHLGRRFMEGVPLHRRGQREEDMLAEFERQVEDIAPTVRFVVQTGDIFDAFTVPARVVLRTAEILQQAAESHPYATYIIYRGNHDGSRDAEKASSFDLLQAILADVVNIQILSEPETFQWLGNERSPQPVSFAVMPWHPFKSALELVPEVKKAIVHQVVEVSGRVQVDMIFTHCDTKSYDNDGENFNLLPREDLAALTGLVVNGHEHTPKQIADTDCNLVIEMPGSMQPYSHGEDPEGRFYVTLTVAEFAETDPETLKDKHVRILLSEGEEIPPAIDCRAFTWKRVVEKEKFEDNDEVVEIADFDLRQILSKNLGLHNTSDYHMKMLLGKYDEAKVIAE
ncbi:putative metallephosphoesterase [Xylophilus phage Lumi]|nr:putative metallephosphoesterase [Xylophilus phage Lumi]